MLSEEQKKLLLSLKQDDVTAEFIYNNFASKCEVVNGKFIKKPPKLKTSDTFYLEAGEYFNTERVLTNVGLFIFNKIIIENRFEKIIGYHNETITNSVYKKIESKLSDALKYDEITVDTFADYLNRLQWLGLQFNSIFSPSLTMGTVRPLKSVIDERDKIYKENKERLENGDIKIAVDMEEKLIDMAKKELKDDPGYELYMSDARVNMGNNYKNMNIMKGPVKSQGEWYTVVNNFTDGISKDDIEAHANAYIAAQYPKSVGTQDAGYLVKRINAGFQAITADKKGSDCGTKHTININITPSNKNSFIDRYIVEGNKIVLMDGKNIDKYVGKTVKLRTPMFCLGGNCKCNVCLGDIYHILGIENVGLSVGRMATTILNLNMKKFHSAAAQLHDIDLNDISFSM